ncbi:amino acid transporter [Ascodesmis nigricans]|uniref:Amino acid transporter n=1 Tax=Ascodesmis nigricans TaxID=341454 RepID=A0A4S2MWP7_9PEZI|nr:amino acid transporter [Ascodesmis nigricans]
MSPSHGYTAAPTRDSLELTELHSPSSSSPRTSTSSSHHDDNDHDDLSSHPRRSRTYSISSAFDFNTHLLPLSSSTTANRYTPLGAPSTLPPSGNLEKQKTLTYLNGLSLLIGLQIGSGIFSSPSQVDNHVPSPGVALVIWTIAGLLAWTGAASYAELGGAIPLNGGSGVYLRHCFGELAGFLFSWTAVMVLKPGSAAIIAIIAGEYFNRVILGSFEAEIGAGGLPGAWANKITAVVMFLVVAAMNMLSTKLTTRIGDAMMFLKVALLAVITVTGIVVAATGRNAVGTEANRMWRERNWFEWRQPEEGRELVMGGVGEYAIALYAGLWAFDGWDNVNYVTGEMRSPSRDLPRVIHTAMPLVILFYLLANTAYYLVLPATTISSSNTVAVAFGTTVFGPTGGLLFALAVSLSCFGALNASTFTSGRLVYVAGKEGYLPRIFGTLGFRTSSPSPSSSRFSRFNLFKSHPWTRTPIYATLLNSFLTLLYILIGEFSTLLTFYGVAGYSFYFLTVLGLIILRVKEPTLERPYKTWIVTPVVFCCVSLFLIVRSVVGRPWETVGVAAWVAVGVPVFWWRVGRWGWGRK